MSFLWLIERGLPFLGKGQHGHWRHCLILKVDKVWFLHRKIYNSFLRYFWNYFSFVDFYMVIVWRLLAWVSNCYKTEYKRAEQNKKEQQKKQNKRGQNSRREHMEWNKYILTNAMWQMQHKKSTVISADSVSLTILHST